jgi:Heat induced stress protein YflT
MSTTNERTFVAAFADPDQARAALQELVDAGVPPGSISVLAHNRRDSERLAHEAGVDDRLAASAWNNRFEDFLGWLSGIGAAVVPGVGPDVATSTLAASFRAGEAGAGEGSLTGALVGLGVPVEEAQGYEEQLTAGRIIGVVRATPDRAGAVEAVLRRHAAT